MGEESEDLDELLRMLNVKYLDLKTLVNLDIENSRSEVYGGDIESQMVDNAEERARMAKMIMVAEAAWSIVCRCERPEQRWVGESAYKLFIRALSSAFEAQNVRVLLEQLERVCDEASLDSTVMQELIDCREGLEAVLTRHLRCRERLMEHWSRLLDLTRDFIKRRGDQFRILLWNYGHPRNAFESTTNFYLYIVRVHCLGLKVTWNQDREEWSDKRLSVTASNEYVMVSGQSTQSELE